MTKKLLFLTTLLFVLFGCSKNENVDPTLSLSKDVMGFNADGVADNSATFVITSNSDWKITSSESWCSVSKTDGNGNETITVTLTPNEGETLRSAVITVRLKSGTKAETININQLGDNSQLTVSKTELNFYANGLSHETNTIAITANAEWVLTYEKESDKSWCTIGPVSGNGSISLTANLTENSTFEARTAVVKVALKSGKHSTAITINQDAREHILKVEPTSLLYDVSGNYIDNEFIIIQATAPWVVTYDNESDKQWCVISSSSGDGFKDLSFTVAPYTNIKPRTASLTLKMLSKEVKLSITQNGTDNVLSAITDLNFKAYCLGLDKNGDGKLSMAEAEAVTSIDVRNMNIQSLAGIEYFTGLQKLSCESNKLSSLDLSANAELAELFCRYNELTTLDLSKNPKISSLYCSRNKLTSLNVSNNTELFQLYCEVNQLSSLDVSKNTKLVALYCSANNLLSLDVSKNPLLRMLSCFENQISSIDVSKNSELAELACSKNKLTSINVSNNLLLKDFQCGGNQIANVDISKNTKLTSFSCAESPISSLNLSKNAALESLGCQNTKLTVLDISTNTKLKYLFCNENPLLTTIYVWSSFNTSNPNSSIAYIGKDNLASFVIKP